MTSFVKVKQDRKRAAVLAIVVHVSTWAVVWTLMIAATGGCRCGSVEKHRSGIHSAIAAGGDSGGSKIMESSQSQSPATSGNNEDRVAKLEAIKAEILEKLGVNSEDDLPTKTATSDVIQPLNASFPSAPPPTNSSLEERRRVINLYRQSIEQLKGKTHRIDDGNLAKAKQFYSFKPVSLDDAVSVDILASVSKRHMFIRFHLDLPSSVEDAESGRNSTKSVTVGPDFVVSSASLKLPRRLANRQRHARKSSVQPASGRQQLRVNVFQVLPAVGNSKRRRRIRRRLVDSRVINFASVAHRRSRQRHKPMFEEFDMLKTVQEWITDPSSNRGLLITVEQELQHNRNSSKRYAIRVKDIFQLPSSASAVSRAASGSLRSSTNGNASLSVPPHTSSASSKSEAGPTLNLLGRQRRANGRRRLSESVNGNHRSRRRRRSVNSNNEGDCRPGDGETRCCRRPLWVSFEEIGWSQWILEPRGYMAYYCEGTCPPQHRVAHKHANIQTLVNGVRPDAAPTPCCAPSRMSPLPIAHLNSDGRAVVSIFEDMVVEECMCT